MTFQNVMTECTDRELLESAAKSHWGKIANQMIEAGYNPLDDDGDALRLAADIQMTIDIRPDISACCSSDGEIEFFIEHDGYDHCWATRRAVVWVAALMWKARQ